MKNCGTVKNWWKMNHKKPSFRSKINAGCIIGKAGKLKEIFTWILEKNFDDDQKGLASWIDLYGSENVALDVGSVIVYNGNIFDMFLKTNKSAVFQHFPGPLLKIGYMPNYNRAITKHLGVYARKTYPTSKSEALLTWFTVLCVGIFILRTFFLKPWK
jgi:hypothetical protein